MRNIRRAAGNGFLIEFSSGKCIRRRDVEKLILKEVQNLIRLKLSAGSITLFLDNGAKFRMHGFGEMIPKVVVHDKRCSTFSGLTVNSDNRFIFTPDISRVDRQIGNLPKRTLMLTHVLMTFINRILINKINSKIIA